MGQHSKSEMLRSYRKRYQKASKKEKIAIIDTIIDATGYSRKHIIRALNDDVQITLSKYIMSDMTKLSDFGISEESEFR